jgi:hypothetical protein
VAVNDNGYVIGNQRYRINKGQNRPVEMFLFNLNKPGTAASLPSRTSRSRGSEAAAINEHNMVVGWRDSRHQTQPVVNGTNRMQEAFLLNAAAPANSWYLNDLICGKDDAGNKQCAQNGKYYHIAYASGISSDGTIAATAYRYDSESDLNKRANATVVASNWRRPWRIIRAMPRPAMWSPMRRSTTRPVRMAAAVVAACSG